VVLAESQEEMWEVLAERIGEMFAYVLASSLMSASQALDRMPER
jgi:hypothetical protein